MAAHARGWPMHHASCVFKNKRRADIRLSPLRLGDSEGTTPENPNRAALQSNTENAFDRTRPPVLVRSGAQRRARLRKRVLG